MPDLKLCMKYHELEHSQINSLIISSLKTQYPMQNFFKWTILLKEPEMIEGDVFASRSFRDMTDIP